MPDLLASRFTSSHIFLLAYFALASLSEAEVILLDLLPLLSLTMMMTMMMTTTTKRNLAAAALVALATMSTSTTHVVVRALESVTISYQPALYWALPIYIAEERGYFADMDLNVSYVTVRHNFN